MADSNNQYQQPPPYPYQQQPLQGHRSGEYSPYPQFNEQQQQQQGEQRWGTPVMGAPANPSAHPDNQQAATGAFTSQPNSSNRQSSGSFQGQAQANQTQSAPGVPGQAPQDPYVQASSTSGTGGKGGSMDQIKAQMTDFSKKVEIAVNRVWGHLSTGPSVADTAWGRVTAGTQLLTKGGFEGMFKSTFPVDADEKLNKTYACFLSTSTGPVAGTLYISNKKLAFCSDRPLSYTPENGQQSYSYYKVIIPSDKVREVNPSVNQSKPAEKYIQVSTTDNFEFWFMGFVNYDKGVKNLQAVLSPGGQQPGGGQHPGESYQQTYPPNQHTGAQQSGGSYQQQPYPPNQSMNQQNYPPNQYGTPAP